MSFEVGGLDEWSNLLNSINEEFSKQKENELRKIGLIAERKIKSFVNVDTGRLRSSINTKIINQNTAEIGTNVDYAKYVNDGFTLAKRFLPAIYLNTPAGRKYLKNGNNKGITLKPQFIQGTHFMEKGLQNAEPEIIGDLNNWFNDFFRVIGA